MFGLFTQIARAIYRQIKPRFFAFRCLPVICACISVLPSYAVGKDMKMTCTDIHSLYVQSGTEEPRSSRNEYILQIDGNMVLTKYKGFPNIYASKIIWRDNSHIVAVEYDKIGGSGITTESIAHDGSGSFLVTRMHVDIVTGVMSSFFSQCNQVP